MGLATGIRRLSTLCILAFLFIPGGCAFQAQPPVSPSAHEAPASGLTEGSLFLPPTSSQPTNASLLTPLATADILARARNADFILIGEGHTVPCDHLVQSRLITALADAGIRFTVGLEMFPVDHQPLLDKVNAGAVPLASFANATDWKTAWGYDFDLYRPVFEAVYAHRLPLRALNVPQPIVKKVSRDGLDALTDTERALLPDAIIPASEDQKAALQPMFDAHRAMANGTMGMHVQNGTMGTTAAPAPPKSPMTGRMDRFFLIQALWDTAMAQQAVRARDTGNMPVVVLIGSGHVEFGWGLAHRIRTLRPGSTILMVSPWRGTDPVDQLEADLRYYCRQTHQSRLGFTLLQEPSGATVLALVPGSRAERAGFLKDDRIILANGVAVDSMWVLHTEAIRASMSGKNMVFTVQRGKTELELSMPVQAVSPAAAPAN